MRHHAHSNQRNPIYHFFVEVSSNPFRRQDGRASAKDKHYQCLHTKEGESAKIITITERMNHSTSGKAAYKAARNAMLNAWIFDRPRFLFTEQLSVYVPSLRVFQRAQYTADGTGIAYRRRSGIKD